MWEVSWLMQASTEIASRHVESMCASTTDASTTFGFRR
jgi:hypothetical protein